MTIYTPQCPLETPVFNLKNRRRPPEDFSHHSLRELEKLSPFAITYPCTYNLTFSPGPLHALGTYFQNCFEPNPSENRTVFVCLRAPSVRAVQPLAIIQTVKIGRCCEVLQIVTRSENRDDISINCRLVCTHATTGVRKNRRRPYFRNGIF